MESDERGNKKEIRNNLSNNRNVPKSIWIRYIGLSNYVINKKLLDYNAYTLCICSPILYLVFYLI